MNLEQIKNESNEAIEIIKLISLISNKKIPSDLLYSYIGLNKKKYSRAIAVLLKHELIKGDGDFYQCHETTHKTIRSYFNKQELKVAYTKVVNLLNQMLPRDVNLLDLYLADKTYYLNHIDKLYKLKDEYDCIADNLITLKVKELEFVVTGIRNGKRAKSIICEIKELIVKNKGIENLDKVKFWLAKSTYL